MPEPVAAGPFPREHVAAHGHACFGKPSAQNCVPLQNLLRAPQRLAPGNILPVGPVLK